jgi:hypothetical protein
MFPKRRELSIGMTTNEGVLYMMKTLETGHIVFAKQTRLAGDQNRDHVVSEHAFPEQSFAACRCAAATAKSTALVDGGVRLLVPHSFYLVRSCLDRCSVASHRPSNGLEKCPLFPIARSKRKRNPNRLPRRYSPGATVGCGVVLPEGRLFFTLNGLCVGTPFMVDYAYEFQPCVSAARLELNVGQFPFVYDTANRYAMRAALTTSPCPVSRKAARRCIFKQTLSIIALETLGLR